MNNSISIWLDIDGVLADFVSGAIKLHKLNITQEEVSDFDLLENIVGKNKFWDTIDEAGEDFWENLKLYPYAKRLVSYLEILSGTDVFFLTAPCLSPYSYSGKIKWAKKHFSKFVNSRRILIFPYKELIAGPDRILIDDKLSNIQKWTQKGGHGIIVPRPWNTWDQLAPKSEKEIFEYILNSSDTMLPTHV